MGWKGWRSYGRARVALSLATPLPVTNIGIPLYYHQAICIDPVIGKLLL